MTERLRIATRQSALALWQAEHVAARLRSAHPGLDVELVPMKTEGDRILDRWFECDLLKGVLATDAIIGAFHSPSSPIT